VPTVVISPHHTVKFLEGGGHFWVYMQYVEGLRRCGCEVYWLEHLDNGDPRQDTSRAEALVHRLKRYGLDGKVILYRDAGTELGVGRDYVGMTHAEATAVFGRADLLLNFHYVMDPELLACFRRTALVDIDPGLLQVWMSAGQLEVARHDIYLTTGDTVGTASASFPDGGLHWLHIRPPVCLELWPYTYDADCEAFTTVTNWWGIWVPETVDGRQVLYDNTKRAAYLAFAELPRLTTQPIELAVHLAAGDTADRQLMEERDWRIRHASEVSRTPEMYRSYIQRSRGELSCVKPSCVKLQNGWISDRSLCYLASGKPVVMQDTGPSSYLPFGEGIFRFSTPAEAVEALATVNTDYAKHCRAARDIAESYFDAREIAERILDVALT
jgi:hypothetical protein